MPATFQWVFGPFRFDPMNRCLWRESELIALKPKTLAVLQYLVEHAGHLVTKAALLEAVWPETAVSDVVLKVCIADLRKALGDRVQAPQFIATAHRYGYRFVASVARVEMPDQLSTPLSNRPLFPLRPVLHLVERDIILERLHTAWAQSRQGQRQTVFVTGEAGIGKTAVVEAFVAQVADAPNVWLGQGQCVEHYGTGEAYLPILEVLGQLCQAPQGDRLVALLRQQAPTWLVQLPWLLTSEDRQRLHHELHGTTRDRMLREFAAVVDTLTVDILLLLVLEDLHWSDYATLDLLAFLARRPTPARVMVLGTYRPVEVRRQEHPLQTVVYGLQRQGHGLEIPLESLSAEAVATYLAARFSGHQFPSDLAVWLHQYTEGTPLFLVTLVANWTARGILAEREGCWQLTTALSELELEVPEGLRPLLEQQLARLAPAAQRVVEVASLAGVEFAAPTVAAVLATGVEDVEAQCDALVRQELLRPVGLTTWPDGTPAMRYAFVHALYQHIAAQRLGDGHKRRLHQRIGRWLERAYGARSGEIAAELAMHFGRGQDTERAVFYRRAAAENALHRYANVEAINHLTTGLALLETLPNTFTHRQDELAMRIMLGSALIAIKGYAAPEVEQTYTRARVLGEQVGDIPQLCGILFGLWNGAFVRAQHQTARDLGAQLLGQAQRQSDALLHLAGYFACGVSLASQGVLAAAREHLAQGVACSSPEQHPRSLALFGIDLGVFCRAWLSHVLWLLGYADQALVCSQEAQTQAQALGHPFSQMLALDYAALLRQLRGEVSHTALQAQAALILGTEQAFTYYLAWATIFRGWVLTARQQREEGIEQIHQGLDALQATGGAVRLPYYWALLTEAYQHAGQVTEGCMLVAKALAHTATTGESWYEAELYRLQGVLLLAQSSEQHAAAHACFQQALTVARRQQARSLELRAALSLSRFLWQGKGKRRAACQLLADVYGWFTEGFETTDLCEAHALLVHDHETYCVMDANSSQS
jgi:DNA-binding winged helix-turn-helix (wHTH) protein/predicted ATPase